MTAPRVVTPAQVGVRCPRCHGRVEHVVRVASEALFGKFAGMALCLVCLRSILAMAAAESL